MIQQRAGGAIQAFDTESHGRGWFPRCPRLGVERKHSGQPVDRLASRAAHVPHPDESRQLQAQWGVAPFRRPFQSRPGVRQFQVERIHTGVGAKSNGEQRISKRRKKGRVLMAAPFLFAFSAQPCKRKLANQVQHVETRVSSGRDLHLNQTGVYQPRQRQ